MTYYIEYLNNGFAPAFEVVIYDTLVSEIAYKVSTADSVSGNTSQISFSNDNTSTWIYSPVGSVDSNVTNIRFSIIGSVPPKYDWPGSGCLKYGTVIK